MLEFSSLRQEGHKFKTNVGGTARPCTKQVNKQANKKKSFFLRHMFYILSVSIKIEFPTLGEMQDNI